MLLYPERSSSFAAILGDEIQREIGIEYRVLPLDFFIPFFSQREQRHWKIHPLRERS